MAKLSLKIGGMSCEHCARAVEEALLALPGVRGARVDLKSKTAGVDCESAECTPEMMKSAVEEAGYVLEEK